MQVPNAVNEKTETCCGFPTENKRTVGFFGAFSANNQTMNPRRCQLAKIEQTKEMCVFHELQKRELTTRSKSSTFASEGSLIIKETLRRFSLYTQHKDRAFYKRSETRTVKLKSRPRLLVERILKIGGLSSN